MRVTLMNSDSHARKIKSEESVQIAQLKSQFAEQQKALDALREASAAPAPADKSSSGKTLDLSDADVQKFVASHWTGMERTGMEWTCVS